MRHLYIVYIWFAGPCQTKTTLLNDMKLCEIRGFRVPPWISAETQDQKKKDRKRHCLADKNPKNNFVLDFHQSSMMGLMKLLSIGFHTFFFGSYWYPGCVESLAAKKTVGEIKRQDHTTSKTYKANQQLPGITENRFGRPKPTW